MHGLRHAYAQTRFEELAGFACPAAGGPTRDRMTPAQREADEDARVLLSEELGHCRPQITNAYLGSSVPRRRAELTPERRAADEDARMILSAELGHGREAITAAYLGR